MIIVQNVNKKCQQSGRHAVSSHRHDGRFNNVGSGGSFNRGLLLMMAHRLETPISLANKDVFCSFQGARKDLSKCSLHPSKTNS